MGRDFRIRSWRARGRWAGLRRMPFTLAHPAAILPLRGIRYLRTAPLIIGALMPDLPYYVPGKAACTWHPETHSIAGSFTHRPGARLR